MSWFSVLLVNLLVIGTVAFLMVRRIERRIEPAAVLDQIRREVDELIVEFNQTTERNIGLIEERIVRLNRLIETADRRVTVLRRELDAHETGARVYSDIVQQATVQRRSQQEHAEQPGEQGGDPGADDRRLQIIDLHEKGIAPNIIAARVGTTVGEVELIVSLKKRKP